MTDNLPPLPSHHEHGWVLTEAEQRAIRANARPNAEFTGRQRRSGAMPG